MRNAFADAVTELARHDQRIILLSGDIGNRLFNTFQNIAPKRFFNCGIAEANMTGVAAGLALTGLRPFTYTITPFVTVRCLDQIRIDLCYHNLPVVVVGTGSGLSYSHLGPTHHSCDDIAILRSYPNITIVCPCDPVEVKLAVQATLNHSGPVYIRLGKKGDPVIHTNTPQFTLGKSIPVRSGTDCCIITTGNIAATALSTAEILQLNGISTAVISMHTVKPLDTAFLKEAVLQYRVIATIEEHFLIGGLGSAVSEWFTDNGVSGTRLVRIGCRDFFTDKVGSYSYLRELHGLTPQAAADKISECFENGALL